MNALSLSAPWEALVFCLLLLVAPVIATTRQRSIGVLLGLVAALSVTLFASWGALAYAAAAAAAVLHAVSAWPASRTGAAWLMLSAGMALATGMALEAGHLTTAFVLSTATVAARAGVVPLHVGVASLCDRAPVVQTQQLASTIALVFIHLRFVDHHAEALALAPTVVFAGAVAAFLGGMLATVQRDLRGFYRASTAMHGGFVLAGLGAASHDNFAAALLVVVAAGLALGGLGIVITSLEERVGAVTFDGPGGHVHAFPRLAAAFALFGAAGVAMPGTAGFVADDLLFHTLWMESPMSTVLVILSSALLAVSTLNCFARVFLGRATTLLAPDLSARERSVATVLFLLLIVLGLSPSLLLGPADVFLSVAPEVAAGPAGIGSLR